MTKNDWYDAGDQIKKLVQDAVDSGDFSQIGSTITNAVNDIYQYTNREAAERIRKNMQQKRQDAEKTKERTRERARSGECVEIIKSGHMSVPGEISGNVMKWVGYSMFGVFGLAAVLYFLLAFTTGILPPGVGLLFALFSGGSFMFASAGRERVGMAKRFRRYCDIVGERTYCLIEELAAATGNTRKFVRKDLKRMIGLGFFKEGYLDRKGTLLITDQDTYLQYLTTQDAYEKRAAKEKKEAQAAKAANSVKESEAVNIEKEVSAEKDSKNAEQKQNFPPQIREIIEEGRGYIAHIHECNVRIEDQEFSAKLDRLELVITRIFCEVEKHPESVDDLKKMMSYYLPTTKKLLDAYCELNEQPIAGDNIENTKREIEQALDVLNAAFEKLLDSMFEETAWDISSDISVLHTMLAQEGLTETEFSKK